MTHTAHDAAESRSSERLVNPTWIHLVELHRKAADPEGAAGFARAFDSALAACRHAAPATR